jgi:uncharacterized membrane protein
MNRRPLIAAGTIIGIGMGGFVDGILFHQILQLHNMLSAKIPPTTLVNVETTMVWDGLFHALTWAVTAIGIGCTMARWKAARRAVVRPHFLRLPRSRVGLLQCSRGNHRPSHFLGLHHVIERLGVSVYDYLFLGSGVLFIVLGWTIVMAGRRDGLSSHPAPAITSSIE